MSDLYFTVTRNEIRRYMPAVPVIVSAAGWAVPQSRKKGTYRLRVPPLPAHVVIRGADCGGIVAATRWGGHYRFTERQYLTWLMAWRPQWAAVMDLACVTVNAQQALVYPGAEEVRRRQNFTTEKAFTFWSCYQDLPLTWVPTIQGWYPEEFARHARDLAPLIHEMYATYQDAGSTDEEHEQQESVFRVGIGSLCGRAPLLVQEIVHTVRAVLGYVPFHLWGTKLGFLRSPNDLAGIVSLDTAVWNNLWGPEHEARRRSGLSEAQYCWDVSYPFYEQRVRAALQQPKFASLIGTSTVPRNTLISLRETMDVQASLPENLCYRHSGEGPGEQRD